MEKIISNLLLAVFAITLVFAQGPDRRSKQFNIEKTGLAIQGYDPVSYFTGNKPLEGKKELAVVYDGITYRFATAQNKEIFRTHPARYEPQYGGWCAYAMGATGEKVAVDPETFKIIDGKLYLFYNKFFNNTLKSWNKDEANLKAHADQSWARFIR